MKRLACLAAVGLLLFVTIDAGAGGRFYNGIEIPEQWPSRLKLAGDKVLPAPSLQHRPDVVPIDVARQLFVDDFLIEKSDLKRVFHYPTRYSSASHTLTKEVQLTDRLK